MPGYRQTQTRAFANRLGGKEGVKYFFANFIRDAGPVVTDGQDDLAILQAGR